MPDLKELARRLEETFPGRCARSFLALGGIDRAMVISAQALTALIPLLLLVSTLAPASRRDVVSTALIRRFELKGEAADAVREVFAQPVGASSVGVLSVVILVFSGVSLARRMQRMYQDAWRLEHRAGVRGSFNTFLGLGALLLDIALLALARSLVRALPLDWLLGVPISLVSGLLLWTFIPWLLLDGRVRWRRLLPTGAVATLCSGVYGVASTIYMPRMMESYSERYGLFGVTLALVGWLLSIALIVVGATVVGAEFDRSQGWFARRVRSGLGVETQPEDRAVEA
ncbi:membrane protein [Kribbella orskensis]|uniref:Membrane protein n=1 Tax=Kribbella orskensis TaxID=2512216 RepID=A0ABY2BEV6_9ACTN|nr:MULTISPECIES: YhjD/YihY/BrkB family envelope integrity protein [Kribbella]TCN36687.1 membrane protein [Kribbella sp. VKM Ac-2500]TCO17926.1 membrane protein [Kribbella orskensis]